LHFFPASTFQKIPRLLRVPGRRSFFEAVFFEAADDGRHVANKFIVTKNRTSFKLKTNEKTRVETATALTSDVVLMIFVF
jgi:hypothetical protein